MGSGFSTQDFALWSYEEQHYLPAFDFVPEVSELIKVDLPWAICLQCKHSGKKTNILNGKLIIFMGERGECETQLRFPEHWERAEWHSKVLVSSLVIESVILFWDCGALFPCVVINL